MRGKIENTNERNFLNDDSEPVCDSNDGREIFFFFLVEGNLGHRSSGASNNSPP